MLTTADGRFHIFRVHYSDGNLYRMFTRWHSRLSSLHLLLIPIRLFLLLHLLLLLLLLQVIRLLIWISLRRGILLLWRVVRTFILLLLLLGLRIVFWFWVGGVGRGRGG